MMCRDDCLKIIDRQRYGAVIVAHFQPAFDLIRIAPNPLNYYAVGAMGQASSHGLGLALGMPRRKIIVLDGDGSLLMNLGSLVTVAEAAPENLVHFVCENGCYETNGSHPIPGAGNVDFAALAKASGYRSAFTISTLDDLEALLPGILLLRGPVFATLKVVPGERSTEDWAFINGPDTRSQFRTAIRDVGIR